MVKRFDDTPALICSDCQVTYRALVGHAEACGSLAGVGSGNRVALMSENRPEWAYALLGAWQAGGTVVPIDCLSTVPEVAHILGDSAPTAVFCSREREAVVRQALEQARHHAAVHVLDDLPKDAPAPTAPYPELPDDRTAVIMYTSGTTGSPKGVMLSLANLHSVMDSVSRDVPIYRADDRVLVLLPLHHILSLQGTLLLPLYLGATCVFSPSMVSEDILKTLQAHGVTLMVGVPRLFTLMRDGLLNRIRANRVAFALLVMARRIRSLAFSRRVFAKVHERFGGKLRYMCCGGAAIADDVVHDFHALGFEMLTGYGMTETSPIISFTHPGRFRDGTAGQVIPVNELRIVDGEITVRGANVMQGYYRRPEDTAAVLRDGWMHTGDLGEVDADGYLTITGRKKEIIVLSNGKKVNPEEIERDLASMPCIKEAAVTAAESVLHAVVVPDLQALAAQGVLNIEEWLRWHAVDKYNRRVSPQKRIRRFTVVTEPLPRTRLGKLKRHELPTSEGRAKSRPATAPEPTGEAYRLLREYLAGSAGTEVHADDHIELDLGLDSLAKVALQVWLSTTFGVDLSENDLIEAPTPRALAERIEAVRTRLQAVETVAWGEILRQAASLRLPRSGFFHLSLMRLARIVFGGVFRLEGSGVEKLPDGPCIIAPNHQSSLDGFFVSAFLRRQVLRDTFMYARTEHLRRRWMRFLAERQNVIVMDLNRNLRESLQKLAHVLRSGKKVIIFPEGTRSRDGSLGDFKQAFAILGAELGVPIVPVAISGAFEALPPGRSLPRFFRKVKVAFLDPVYPRQDTYSSLTQRVFQAVAERLRQAGVDTPSGQAPPAAS